MAKTPDQIIKHILGDKKSKNSIESEIYTSDEDLAKI